MMTKSYKCLHMKKVREAAEVLVYLHATIWFISTIPKTETRFLFILFLSFSIGKSETEYILHNIPSLHMPSQHKHIRINL